MSGYKVRLICLLLLPIGAGADEQAARLMLSRDAATSWRLEVRQQPLPGVLKTITEKTGVPIHYSVLPQALITSTCVGATVKQVLECLFNKKADLVFRYKNNAAQNRPEEVWVLSTNVDVEQASISAGAETQHPIPNMSAGADGTEPMDKLLEQVKADDPVQRADAVARLSAEQQSHDGAIDSVLVSALSDKNAEVRAQAVFALAKRDSTGAPVVLQQALQDSDASVRLMAVDNAGDNVALLQQALNDSDETVRAYAATKLEKISNGANVQ
jgi:hypothetical protein